MAADSKSRNLFQDFCSAVTGSDTLIPGDDKVCSTSLSKCEAPKCTEKGQIGKQRTNRVNSTVALQTGTFSGSELCSSTSEVDRDRNSESIDEHCDSKPISEGLHAEIRTVEDYMDSKQGNKCNQFEEDEFPCLKLELSDDNMDEKSDDVCPDDSDFSDAYLVIDEYKCEESTLSFETDVLVGNDKSNQSHQEDAHSETKDSFDLKIDSQVNSKSGRNLFHAMEMDNFDSDTSRDHVKTLKYSNSEKRKETGDQSDDQSDLKSTISVDKSSLHFQSHLEGANVVDQSDRLSVNTKVLEIMDTDRVLAEIDRELETIDSHSSSQKTEFSETLFSEKIISKNESSQNTEEEVIDGAEGQSCSSDLNSKTHLSSCSSDLNSKTHVSSNEISTKLNEHAKQLTSEELSISKNVTHELENMDNVLNVGTHSNESCIYKNDSHETENGFEKKLGKEILKEQNVVQLKVDNREVNTMETASAQFEEDIAVTRNQTKDTNSEKQVESDVDVEDKVEGQVKPKVDAEGSIETKEPISKEQVESNVDQDDKVEQHVESNVDAVDKFEEETKANDTEGQSYRIDSHSLKVQMEEVTKSNEQLSSTNEKTKELGSINIDCIKEQKETNEQIKNSVTSKETSIECLVKEGNYDQKCVGQSKSCVKEQKEMNKQIKNSVVNKQVSIECLVKEGNYEQQCEGQSKTSEITCKDDLQSTEDNLKQRLSEKILQKNTSTEPLVDSGDIGEQAVINSNRELQNTPSKEQLQLEEKVNKEQVIKETDQQALSNVIHDESMEIQKESQRDCTEQIEHNIDNNTQIETQSDVGKKGYGNSLEMGMLEGKKETDGKSGGKSVPNFKECVSTEEGIKSDEMEVLPDKSECPKGFEINPRGCEQLEEKTRKTTHCAIEEKNNEGKTVNTQKDDNHEKAPADSSTKDINSKNEKAPEDSSNEDINSKNEKAPEDSSNEDINSKKLFSPNFTVEYLEDSSKYVCSCGFTDIGKKFADHLVINHLIFKPYKCVHCKNCFETTKDIEDHTKATHANKTKMFTLLGAWKGRRICAIAAQSKIYSHKPAKMNDAMQSTKISHLKSSDSNASSSDCESPVERATLERQKQGNVWRMEGNPIKSNTELLENYSKFPSIEHRSVRTCKPAVKDSSENRQVTWADSKDEEASVSSKFRKIQPQTSRDNLYAAPLLTNPQHGQSVSLSSVSNMRNDQKQHLALANASNQFIRVTPSDREKQSPPILNTAHPSLSVHAAVTLVPSHQVIQQVIESVYAAEHSHNIDTPATLSVQTAAPTPNHCPVNTPSTSHFLVSDQTIDERLPNSHSGSAVDFSIADVWGNARSAKSNSVSASKTVLPTVRKVDQNQSQSHNTEASDRSKEDDENLSPGAKMVVEKIIKILETFSYTNGYYVCAPCERKSNDRVVFWEHLWLHCHKLKGDCPKCSRDQDGKRLCSATDRIINIIEQPEAHPRIHQILLSRNISKPELDVGNVTDFTCSSKSERQCLTSPVTTSGLSVNPNPSGQDQIPSAEPPLDDCSSCIQVPSVNEEPDLSLSQQFSLLRKSVQDTTERDHQSQQDTKRTEYLNREQGVKSAENTPPHPVQDIHCNRSTANSKESVVQANEESCPSQNISEIGVRDTPVNIVKRFIENKGVAKPPPNMSLEEFRKKRREFAVEIQALLKKIRDEKAPFTDVDSLETVKSHMKLAILRRIIAKWTENDVTENISLGEHKRNGCRDSLPSTRQPFSNLDGNETLPSVRESTLSNLADSDSVGKTINSSDASALSKVKEDTGIDTKAPKEEVKHIKFYSCPLCPFSTLLHTNHKKHLTTKHPHKTVLCIHCGFRTEAVDIFMKHLSRHTQPNNPSIPAFRCRIEKCGYMCNTLNEFMKHLKAHQDYSPQCTHMCHDCDEVFDSLNALHQHYKSNLFTVVTCPTCRARSTDRKSILDHIGKHHPNKGRMVSVLKQLICKIRKENNYNSNEVLAIQHEWDKFDSSDIQFIDDFVAEPACDNERSEALLSIESSATNKPIERDVDYINKANDPEPTAQVNKDTQSCVQDSVRIHSDAFAEDSGVKLLDENDSLDKGDVADCQDSGLKCNLCSFVADRSSVLDHHISVHNRGEVSPVLKDFCCMSCPSTFSDLCDLEDHYRHHDEKISFTLYECNVDEYKSNVLSNFHNHLKECHSESRVSKDLYSEGTVVLESKVVSCSGCNFKCINKAVLAEHRKNCQRSTDTALGFHTVYAALHNSFDAEKEFDGVDTILSELYKRGKKLLYCRLCKKSFKFKKSLHIHIYHHLAIPFQCWKCEFSDKQFVKVKSHIKEDHGFEDISIRFSDRMKYRVHSLLQNKTLPEQNAETRNRMSESVQATPVHVCEVTSNHQSPTKTGIPGSSHTTANNMEVSGVDTAQKKTPLENIPEENDTDVSVQTKGNKLGQFQNSNSIASAISSCGESRKSNEGENTKYNQNITTDESAGDADKVCETKAQRTLPHLSSASQRSNSPKKPDRCHKKTAVHRLNSPKKSSTFSSLPLDKRKSPKSSPRKKGGNHALKVKIKFLTERKKLEPSPKYQCPNCNFTTDFDEDVMKKHLKEHGVENVYECEKCAVKFNSYSQLDGHNRLLHHGQTNFKALSIAELPLSAVFKEIKGYKGCQKRSVKVIPSAEKEVTKDEVEEMKPNTSKAVKRKSLEDQDDKNAKRPGSENQNIPLEIGTGHLKSTGLRHSAVFKKTKRYKGCQKRSVEVIPSAEKVATKDEVEEIKPNAPPSKAVKRKSQGDQDERNEKRPRSEIQNMPSEIGPGHLKSKGLKAGDGGTTRKLNTLSNTRKTSKQRIVTDVQHSKSVSKGVTGTTDDISATNENGSDLDQSCENLSIICCHCKKKKFSCLYKFLRHCHIRHLRKKRRWTDALTGCSFDDSGNHVSSYTEHCKHTEKFLCLYCSFRCSTRDVVENHLKVNHGDSEKEWLKLKVDREVTESARSSLRSKVFNQKDRKMTYRCPFCRYKIGKLNVYCRHLAKHKRFHKVSKISVWKCASCSMTTLKEDEAVTHPGICDSKLSNMPSIVRKDALRSVDLKPYVALEDFKMC